MRVIQVVAVLSLLVLAVGVPPAGAHDGEHHGKQETGWPGSARAQAQARAFIADSQPAQELSSASGGTACIGGSAGGYPCSNVDLQSFLPLADIGGGKGNDVWGWTDTQTGKEYALMGRTTGTSFVDVTVATNPVYLGNLPTTRFSSTWRDIKVYGNYAYIVSESRGHGMQVFDLTRLRGVTSPVTFSATTTYKGFNTAHNVFINEATGYAYAIGTDTCSGGLHIVDLSNPTQPTQAGCFSADGYTHDVQCVVSSREGYLGREICFASNEDTLTVVDVTSKSNPIQLARRTYTGAAYTHQGWLTADQRYFLIDDEADEGKGINTRTYVFDVANPGAPVHVGTHVGTNPAIDHNQYIVGNHTYQANYRSGLRILAMNDLAKASLAEVGFFDIYPADDAPEFNGAWSTYPFFRSGNVLVSGIEQGLYVLKPTLVDTDTPPAVSITEPGDGATVAGNAVRVAASASDDGAVTAVEFFVDGSLSIGLDTDASDGWSAVWDTTAVADGEHTLTATATDDAGQTASHTVKVVVRNSTATPTTMHIADLAGSSGGSGNKWSAKVTISVVDSAGNAVAGATVSGTWSAGTVAASSCTTDSVGRCSVTSGSIAKRTGSVTFSVTGAQHPTLAYDAASNVESSITIAKP